MATKLFDDDEDYYIDGNLVVMTAEYHIKRGYCCGSGCKFCPYEPKHQRGNIQLNDDHSKKNLVD